MKGLFKFVTGLTALCACFVLCTSDIHAETGIYVGKDVSAEGTTLIGASLETETGLSAIPVIIEKGVLKKGEAIELQNGFSYTLPEDNAKVVVERLMEYCGYGDWNITASNEYGVSVVVGVRTITTEDAVIADPFVENGVCEEKLPLILASTSKNAKEAVDLLCALYDEYGADEAGIVLIADQDGAWAVENFTGHEYVAVKLPSDMMATFSNEPIIRTADPEDKDTICSDNLLTLPVDNGFAVYDDDKNIDLILTYSFDNSYEDESHIREWEGHNIFAPSQATAYDPDMSIDAFFAPDEKVDTDQAFSFFRDRFEGTDYDLSDQDNANMYWGINNQTVGNVSIIQIFDDVPAQMSTVLWTTPSNPTAAPFIPVPVIADSIPEVFSSEPEEITFGEDILAFDFGKLNSMVYYRRHLYGDAIRRFWEGAEDISVKKIVENTRGGWAEDFNSSEATATADANDYLAEVIDLVHQGCDKLTTELDWYLFRGGIRSTVIPDEDLQAFETTFDAVTCAEINGWETTIEGDVFTATRDGKTIQVVFDGEDCGTVVFTGFDDEEFADDIYVLNDFDEEEEDVTVAVEETPAEEAAAEETADLPTVEPEAKEEAEPADFAEENMNDSNAELTEKASKQAEVDTIAALQSYFAEKIADVPRDGWSEAEIASELGDVSNDVVGIIAQHFNGDVMSLLSTEELQKLGVDIASDPGMADVGYQLADTGLDLTALMEKYFMSAAEDVTEDVYNGRLTQQGAIDILTEAEGNIEGIIRLYVEGVTGALSQVFDTTMPAEEYLDIFAELGEGTLDALDDYEVIDRDALGLGDIDLTELTDADIEVVVTLDGLDEDVLDGLSALFGVDVKATLDGVVEQLTGSGVVVENHEMETANAAPTEEEAAVQELTEALSEDDIEIPQEIIDLLNEAIAAAGEEAEAADSDSVVMINPFIHGSDGKVALPTTMLRYFE